jgi:hypothetical protein
MGKERGRISRRGLLRALGRLGILVALLVLLYVDLAQSGVIRSPFFPITRGDIELARSDKPGLRVLFIGNSFTFYNSMPHMVHELAAADPGGRPVFAVERTRMSWDLSGATDDPGLVDLLDDVPWDAVVLQERSWVLSYPAGIRAAYPFASRLSREIERTGALPVLFMTWGYEHGEYGGDTYEAMQGRLEDGYDGLAATLGTPVARVGAAWAAAVYERPGLELWAGDGRHPNRAGSYLAACVFYRMLSGRDAEGSGFTAGLETGDARFLQRIADEVVRADDAELMLEPRVGS